MRTSPFGSPALRRPTSLALPLGSRRSCALVGSRLGPVERVGLTRRLRSSRWALAAVIMWKGSATWPAWGSASLTAVLATPPSRPPEQRLVQLQRRYRTDALRVVDERLAVVDHGVVHRVPVTAQLLGHIGHGPAVPTDLRHAHRPARVVNAARRGANSTSPQSTRPAPIRAGPPVLAPHQPRFISLLVRTGSARAPPRGNVRWHPVATGVRPW